MAVRLNTCERTKRAQAVFALSSPAAQLKSLNEERETVCRQVYGCEKGCRKACGATGASARTSWLVSSQWQ